MDANNSDLRYRSFKLSLTILKLASKFPSRREFWIIADQLIRSATSIGANIIEAKASSSKKDFINFYHIALKSANETSYWLLLLRDGDLVPKDKIQPIIDEVDQICKMLGSSIITMKKGVK